MKKVFFLLIITVFVPSLKTEETKTVEITGALVAPWEGGSLCTRYWYDQKKVRQCFNVKAGNSYIIRDIPKRVKHLKVSRVFNKTCTKKPNGKISCHSVRGKFTLKKPYTNLDLTYDQRKTFKFHPIPPAEPESYFGYPQKFPSIRFMPSYMGDTAPF